MRAPSTIHSPGRIEHLTESPERRALREIAKHPLGDTPTQLLISAHSMQAIAIAALDRSGSLSEPAHVVCFAEPSVRDHEFGDYEPDFSDPSRHEHQVVADSRLFDHMRRSSRRATPEERTEYLRTLERPSPGWISRAMRFARSAFQKGQQR